MSAYRFHPTILRAYDIRGIFEDTLTTGDAFAIGLSFISIQKQRGLGNEVTVGRDGRLSSPALAAALIDGLVAGGAQVSDIGCGPTPMLYFAAQELGSGGAIQVTGSHNPPTHNGFKMVMEGHHPPAGEVYQPVEGGNGELGFYLVSDGSGDPVKCRVRPPCFNYVQAMPELALGHYVADIIAIFGSINMIGGELDR